MSRRNIAIIISIMCIFSFITCKSALSQYNNAFYTNSLTNFNKFTQNTAGSYSYNNRYLKSGNQSGSNAYNIPSMNGSIFPSLNMIPQMQQGNIFGNTPSLFNMVPFTLPSALPQPFNMSKLNTSMPIYNNSLFTQTPFSLPQANNYLGGASQQLFAPFSAPRALALTKQPASELQSDNNGNVTKPASTAIDTDIKSKDTGNSIDDQVLEQQLLSLIASLEIQLEEYQQLAMTAGLQFGDTLMQFSETVERIMQSSMDGQTQREEFIETVLPLVFDLVNKGMDLGYEFASQGMELGYQFASQGEEVGPMANRILFMATQIGVMADRIGEMADRILFMADRIEEFGNKIVYVSQLIVYTEQLIVNVSVLINDNIKTLSDMILTLAAIVTDNTDYLQLRVDYLQADTTLPFIYENMNLMLHYMHEYSMKLLENEAAQHENELAVREIQLQLREETQKANECFCPCFCVNPDECLEGCI